MSTPLSEQTSAEKLEILGRKHAVSHFEKGNFVDSPNEEVQKWLDRNHVMTTQAEFDALHDAYCKGFQSYHVEKWISELTPEQATDLRQRLVPSDPKTSPLPVSVAQASSSVDHVFSCLKSIRRYIDGLAEGPHKTAMIKGWNFMVYGVEDPGPVTLHPDWLKSITGMASPASSVVPAPLVPEVVKAAPEGSVCEVEPLGEVDPVGVITFRDSDGDPLQIMQTERGVVLFTESDGVALDASQTRSFTAHLAAWLATGSFDLKSLPSSPPSSEDTELLTESGWLPMWTAPHDGNEIEMLMPDGEICAAVWSDRPVCMLGSRCGGFPPGWATPVGGDTDPNLPIDEGTYWRLPKGARASTTSQKGGHGA